MVQYLINNSEGRKRLFMCVLGGSMRYHPFFFASNEENSELAQRFDEYRESASVSLRV